MRGVPSVSKTGGSSYLMLVMCSNDASKVYMEMALVNSGKLGWLLSPQSWKNPPQWMPYALDNGAFGCWKNRSQFDEAAFYRHVERGAGRARWIVVPDVVADRDETLRAWDRHAPRLDGLPLAFAVQDGMTPGDVPGEASVIFVGGTTAWKWKTVRLWCAHFERVHVARVNTRRQLLFAQLWGAESSDGTGWFRGNKNQLSGLIRFLSETPVHTPQ